jgi:Ca-activated chloride channel family protein
MKLTHLWVLHLLWLVPLTAAGLFIAMRRQHRILNRFAEPHLLRRLTGQYVARKNMLKACLLLSALSLILFTLAGPRWGTRYQEMHQKGVDILLVVDVSPSMLVEDVKPNRLERARREIVDFLRVVQGDRIGLVAFSGDAFVQCPLTLDYGALEMFLNQLEPDLIPTPGTDLGKALETAQSSFDHKAETDKVIVLITDGEDNENRGLEAARRASEKGIKVFVFGIGETTGGPVPSLNGQGGFKKDKEGKLILSKLEEKQLEAIAKVSGGAYVRAMTGDLDLDILYFEGIKEKTEAEILKSGKIKVHEERFYIFSLAAFLLLLLEALIRERKVIP